MISAISGVSSTSSSSSSTSVQALSEDTKAELEALGVDTSPILTETQGQTALKEAQSSQNQASWASEMENLWLTSTGEIDTDKSTVNDALANMDAKEAQTIASTFQSLGLSVEAPQQNQQTDMYAGQDQLAQMNKYFLVS